MKKYLHNKKDCIKNQPEDEHIVIIQLNPLELLRTSPGSTLTSSPVTPENKISAHLAFSLFPASTRVH